MCAITGEFRFDGGSPDKDLIDRITRAQAFRGPDGHGSYINGTAALGHSRLKIIDLSDRAAQPMRDADNPLVIVFNGCIYNYPELRELLEARGHTFGTTSDTEVILKAYAEWGRYCVDRMNGMFAFAIYEETANRLFVARDRLGIKPLYYSNDGRRFRFASFLPALAHEEEEKLTTDPVALNHYMSFHAVVPAPNTIFSQIRKVPPATRLIIEADGRIEEEKYWEPEFRRPAESSATFDDMRERVLAAMDASVRRRMIADVPVGVLLSGGVDSSLVVGMLARAGVTGLNTFSVGFESVNGEEGNEFRYSDVIAEEFGSRHHRFTIGTDELISNLPACIRSMSEPMVSHDAIGFYLLSREVAKHVKVVQSGQGADEIFGGYYWYPPLLDSEDAAADYARHFLDRDHEEMARAISPGLMTGEVSREFIDRIFAGAPADTPVDQALFMDTTVMLVDDPLKRVDNMTMAWGLEGRVPFLDHEMVELAAEIPPEWKLENGGKHILKEAAREVIPAAVIDRPKGFFPVPELKYLRGQVLDFVKDALNSRRCRERGIFRRAYVDELLDAPTEHITPLRGSKLWQVATLEMWLQAHDF